MDRIRFRPRWWQRLFGVRSEYDSGRDDFLKETVKQIRTGNPLGDAVGWRDFR
jgi:hypothetical protein